MLYKAVKIIVVGIKNSISWEGGLTILNVDKIKDKVWPKVKKVTTQKTVLISLKVYTIVRAHKKSKSNLDIQKIISSYNYGLHKKYKLKEF